MSLPSNRKTRNLLCANVFGRFVHMYVCDSMYSICMENRMHFSNRIHLIFPSFHFCTYFPMLLWIWCRVCRFLKIDLVICVHAKCIRMLVYGNCSEATTTIIDNSAFGFHAINDYYILHYDLLSKHFAQQQKKKQRISVHP